MLESSLNRIWADAVETYRDPKKETTFAMERPGRIPDNIWERLDAPQRAVAVARATQQRYLAAVRDLLMDTDRLRMVYPGITDDDIKTVLCCWANARGNLSNSTTDALVRTVIERGQRGLPFQCCLTNCLTKNEAVQEGAFRLFFELPQRRPERFIDGFQPRGWKAFRSILDGVPRETDASIILGSGDFYNIDRCGEWCTADELVRLEAECEQWRGTVQAQADAFFGQGRVRVRLWSQECPVGAVEEERLRAASNTTWRTPTIARTSRNLYRKWGYETLAYQSGIDDDALERFRRYGDTNAAAEYRAEANVLMARQSIQCFAEDTDPIGKAGYDGGALPACLLLND